MSYKLQVCLSAAPVLISGARGHTGNVTFSISPIILIKRFFLKSKIQCWVERNQILIRELSLKTEHFPSPFNQEVFEVLIYFTF